MLLNQEIKALRIYAKMRYSERPWNFSWIRGRKLYGGEKLVESLG